MNCALRALTRSLTGRRKPSVLPDGPQPAPETLAYAECWVDSRTRPLPQRKGPSRCQRPTGAVLNGKSSVLSTQGFGYFAATKSNPENGNPRRQPCCRSAVWGPSLDTTSRFIPRRVQYPQIIADSDSPSSPVWEKSPERAYYRGTRSGPTDTKLSPQEGDATVLTVASPS